MDIKKIDQIFADTAYVRMGGSEEELKCANYLKAKCEELGIKHTKVEKAAIRKRFG